MSSPRPLRVLHNVETWLPQTQTWLYHQVANLPADIESHIVCTDTCHLDQFQVPNIHSARDQSWLRRRADSVLRRLGQRRAFMGRCARDWRADVLHSHFGHLGWHGLRTARRLGLKHVVTFYGFDVGYLPRQEPVWRERYAELFRQVDKVLCEGPHMGKCIAALGCAPAKIQVHHLGVEVQRIPFRPRQWRPGSPLRVLLAGSFTAKKGFPDALRALARVARDTELEVTIIGDATGVPASLAEKERILAAIGEGGLAKQVRLLGYQPYRTLLEEAARHAVFLSPSVTAAHGDTEGGAPMTLIEMAASGMAVVSTRHCDIPHVLEDGAGGLLAEEHDVEGLVERLRWLIAHPGRWEAMACAARQRIEVEFNAARQGQRLAEIYRAL